MSNMRSVMFFGKVSVVAYLLIFCQVRYEMTATMIDELVLTLY